MKKKIALFLVAALISVGLILSCGGDDKPAGQYTVTFDTDGGDPATIEPIKVDAGKAVGAVDWPADPTRGTDVFDGWFEGTTEYKFNTKIEKNVALKAKYSPFVPPTTDEVYVKALGGITWKNNASQQGWRSNGTDSVETDLEWEDIQYAKYLVLHTKGGTDATEGADADAPDTWLTQFNLIQVVAQGDGNGYGWAQTNLSAVQFTRAADKDVYVVVDLLALKDFDKIVSGTKGKILIAYWNCVNMFQGLGLQEAYLTNKDIAKPADAVDIVSNADSGIGGYVTAENILGLTAPATTFTVTFNADGGTPAITPIVVADGKSLGVRYPDYVTKAGYSFDGWFDGSTEYTANTPITADVTVKAKWVNTYVFANINGAEKIGGTYQGTNAEWAINGKFPFQYFVVAAVGVTNRDGFGGVQFGVQGGGVSQKVRTTGDWTSISNAVDEIVYLIIDVSVWSNFDDASNAVWAQFRVNYGNSELGKYQGYLVTAATLTKPEGAVDFSQNITGSAVPGSSDTDPFLIGYATKVLPVELQ